MTKRLHISDDLSLPLDSVTQTFAILGIRGSGKTNTGVVLFEEMQKHHQQCVALDPTNAWFGIRSSRDGKHDGFKVYVFGGANGDLPLEGTHGAIMADFVVETGASVVFSLRHLSMNDQRRFTMEFGERLHFLKGKPDNRTPLCLFLDEADEFVPQRIPKGYERMFGAYDRLVRRDRNCGLGVVLISQRPQVINKDTLSQIETLICHRLLHKLDRKSVKEAWVEGHDIHGKADEFFGGLASLAKGDTWVWSPEWLDIFKKVRIRQRETFDSSATPKAGEKIKIAHKLAAVDLEKLKERLSETMEKARADDPKALRSEIARLQRELKAKAGASASVSSPAKERIVEKVIKVADPAAIESALVDRDASWTIAVMEFRKKTAETIDKMVFVEPRRQRVKVKANSAPTPTFTHKTYGYDVSIDRKTGIGTISGPSVRDVQVRVPAESNGSGTLTGPEQRLLNALAWMESIGVHEPKQPAVSFLAGYKYGAGSFNNPRGSLRVKGLISYLSDNRMALTDAGRAKAQTPEGSLSSGELQRRVLDVLPGPERRILSVLIDAYPDALTHERTAELSHYAFGSGAYNNPKGKLKTLELVSYPERGTIRAADLLFVE